MNQNDSPKVVTTSDKLREILPSIRTKLADALKNDPLVLFACECFLMLVVQVMDDLALVTAKNEIAVMALKKVGEQMEADGREISSLRTRAINAEQAHLSAQGELNRLRASLAQLTGQPSHGLGSQVDLTFREAVLSYLGRKIEAIKCIRERLGLGLADAKNAIERHVPPSRLVSEMDLLTQRYDVLLATQTDGGVALMLGDLRVNAHGLTRSYEL